jgi:hypothetical protein
MSKMRAWGCGKVAEQVFSITIWRFELVLWKDITPPTEGDTK